MRVRISPTSKIPYLNKSVIEKFANIAIVSENGKTFSMNHLLLISWSSYFKKLLEDARIQDQDTITISTNCSQSDLKTVSDFIMTGILPCQEVDILNGKLCKGKPKEPKYKLENIVLQSYRILS